MRASRKKQRPPHPLPDLIRIYRQAYARLKLSDRPDSERQRLARCVLVAGTKEASPPRVLSEAIRLFIEKVPLQAEDTSAHSFSLAALLKSIEQRLDETDG